MIDPFAELAQMPRWVIWGGPQGKAPRSAKGGAGKVDDAATWAPRAVAQEYARRLLNGAAGGIGIVLGDLGTDLYLCGLDLDSCLDDGLPADWAAEIVGTVRSYCEVGPSGRGLKLFSYIAREDVRPFLNRIGVPADSWGTRRGIGQDSANHGPAVEIYCALHYFTVTGQHWGQSPPAIRLLDWDQLLRLVPLIPPPAAAGGQAGAGGDNSRSARALGAARRWYRATRSPSFEDMCAMLLGHADPEIGAWAREKGEASGGRQFKNIWNKIAAPKNRPVIRVVPGERHLAADAGLDVLAATGVEFFIRGPVLVRIALIPVKTTDGREIMLPGIVPLGSAALLRALALAAEWQRFDGRAREWRPVDPPEPVAEQILALVGDELPFPPLSGVITCPTLRPDGSLLTAEGYDPATGLYLAGTIELPPIPEYPNRGEAETALGMFKALLAEFPFVDEASRSVALSMLIMPPARAAVGPAVPMHAISAPAPGTGKSYLCNLASMIATGKPAAALGVDRTLEETEKRLVAALLAGHPIICLDNIRELLEGPILCHATEQPLIELRRLGSSDLFEIPNTFTVLCNGNNLVIADDLTRRTITAALDANIESPETRTFSTDPVTAVRGDRGAYVAGALVIVRAYLAAGMPGRLPPLPSYRAWSDRVRSALAWLGEADPVETMARAREADPVRQARAALFVAWAAELGIAEARLAGELTAAAEEYNTFTGKMQHPELYAALLVIAERRGQAGRLEERRLGRWLNRNENTVAAGYKLTVDRSDKTRLRWRLARV